MSEVPVEEDARPWDPGRAAGPLRTALLESRQRWRDLVGMAADLVFETDHRGILTLIEPDPALGWPAAALLGRPAALLLPGGEAGSGSEILHATVPIRRRRAWLRRGDGGTACVLLSLAPLLDQTGRVLGVRGAATDISDLEGQGSEIAAALRRCQVIEHVLWRVRQEVLAPRMMEAMLSTLKEALGAEGAAVAEIVGGTPVLVQASGENVAPVLARVGALVAEADPHGKAAVCRAADRPLLVAATATRFCERAGLALWRHREGRDWDEDERALVSASAGILGMVLEHHAIQREMANQARTDPLTGLLNRRAFLEELPRHIERLEREAAPGTLMYADLDRFKTVNDRLGHEAGDRVVRGVAELLRNAVRPTDLVARLGGDEFVLWMNGADHLTAAERAERLRIEVPRVMAELAPGMTGLGLSIGIATRRPGMGEEIGSVMQRADRAMYEVKRSGRGHWRVSLAE